MNLTPLAHIQLHYCRKCGNQAAAKATNGLLSALDPDIPVPMIDVGEGSSVACEWLITPGLKLSVVVTSAGLFIVDHCEHPDSQFHIETTDPNIVAKALRSLWS